MANQADIDWITHAATQLATPVRGDSATGLASAAANGWHLLARVASEELAVGLHARYPNRTVIPFARRHDSDDVACLVVEDPARRGGSILIIHDYASPGWEVHSEFAELAQWFGSAFEP